MCARPASSPDSHRGQSDGGGMGARPSRPVRGGRLGAWLMWSARGVATHAGVLNWSTARAPQRARATSSTGGFSIWFMIMCVQMCTALSLETAHMHFNMYHVPRFGHHVPHFGFNSSTRSSSRGMPLWGSKTRRCEAPAPRPVAAASPAVPPCRPRRSRASR
jgi:hypothetical protein